MEDGKPPLTLIILSLPRSLVDSRKKVAVPTPKLFESRDKLPWSRTLK